MQKMFVNKASQTVGNYRHDELHRKCVEVIPARDEACGVDAFAGTTVLLEIGPAAAPLIHTLADTGIHQVVVDIHRGSAVLEEVHPQQRVLHQGTMLIVAGSQHGRLLVHHRHVVECIAATLVVPILPNICLMAVKGDDSFELVYC